MKVKSLTYYRVFPIAQYINERIGIEVELSETDNPDDVFDFIKEWTHSKATEKSMLPLEHIDRNQSLPIVQVEKIEASLNKEDARWLTLMDDCKDEVELGVYKDQIPTHLIPSFMKKMKSFFNKTVAA
jgi:hypothetical protein